MSDSSESAFDLVQEMASCGAYLVPVGAGQVALRGQIPESLLLRLQMRRDEVVAAAEMERDSRYNRVPRHAIPLRQGCTRGSAERMGAVARYVSAQSDDVRRWVAERSDQYAAGGTKLEAARMAASTDLLQWQLPRHADPVEVLLGLAEALAWFLKVEQPQSTI